VEFIRSWTMTWKSDSVVTVSAVDRLLGPAVVLLKRGGGRLPRDHFHLGIAALLDGPAGVRCSGFEVPPLGSA